MTTLLQSQKLKMPFFPPKLVRQTCRDITDIIVDQTDVYNKEICDEAFASIKKLVSDACSSMDLFSNEMHNPNFIVLNRLRRNCLIQFLKLKDCIDVIEMTAANFSYVNTNLEYIKKAQSIVRVYSRLHQDLNDKYDHIMTCILQKA